MAMAVNSLGDLMLPALELSVYCLPLKGNFSSLVTHFPEAIAS